MVTGLPLATTGPGSAQMEGLGRVPGRESELEMLALPQPSPQFPAQLRLPACHHQHRPCPGLPNPSWPRIRAGSTHLPVPVPRPKVPSTALQERSCDSLSPLAGSRPTLHLVPLSCVVELWPSLSPCLPTVPCPQLTEAEEADEGWGLGANAHGPGSRAAVSTQGLEPQQGGLRGGGGRSVTGSSFGSYTQDTGQGGCPFLLRVGESLRQALPFAGL